MHRLDLDLDSHLKEFLENGIRTQDNSKGKIPLPEKVPSEMDRTQDAASSRTANPTHYQLSYCSPGQSNNRRNPFNKWYSGRESPALLHLEEYISTKDEIYYVCIAVGHQRQ